jgi:hypothetical protein
MDWTWLYGVALVGLNNLALYVWKPWAGAYAGEKGKNLARKEDLNEILAEVRAVAVAQKETEAMISGELWDRQWRMNQKRDAYADLVAALSRLVDAHFRASQRVLHEGVPEFAYRDLVHAEVAEVFRAGAMALIFCTPKTSEVLHEVFGPPIRREELGKYGDNVAKIIDAIIAEARIDLGLTLAMPPPNDLSTSAARG